MKKKCVGHSQRKQKSLVLKKMMTIMKLTTLLFFLALMQVTASTYSQVSKLTLDFKDRKLEDIFSEIERMTDYSVFYTNELIENSALKTGKYNDRDVFAILDDILQGEDLSYEVKGKLILIVSKEEGVNNTNFTQKQSDVKGKVTDPSGGPLPGVTVVVKGTTTGTITNVDGSYNLTNVSGGATLIFSFVGMKTREVPVAGKIVVDVALEEETIGLEEVVAVGYGTIRKSDLTGSVAKVKVEDISERSVTSVQQLLQGQVSGVQITQNTGAAGSGISFAIRGASSISGSNQPLIVIDGYPVEADNNSVKVSDGSSYQDISTQVPDNPLSGLSPSDIESVEILKDASATAIYGSRAANGVVLITTKRGVTGKVRITGSYRYDISSLPHKIDVLNTEDYIKYSNEAYLNSGQDSIYNSAAIADYMQTNTNWQDLIYRTAGSKDYNLNISGGNNDIKYAVMLGYLQQEGIVENNSFDRGSIRINLDAQISKKFRFGLNMSGAKSVNQAVMQSTDRYQTSGSVVTGALYTRPLLRPYDANDELDITFQGNPWLMVTKAKDDNWVTSVVANMFMEYEILKGLKFRIRGGVNNVENLRKFYHPRGTLLGDLNNGYAYFGNGNSFNYLTEYTLNFNRTFNKKHRVSAVSGYTWQNWKRNTFGMFAQDFPSDDLTYHNLSLAGAVNKPKTSTSEWALASLIERVNYSFDNRYLFTFTGRYDGSTRLADGNKWVFFPSIALGWNIHNEGFMKSVDKLSELKVRASYGLSGNQSIGVGSTKARISNNNAVINQTLVTSYLLANMPNANLGWEITKQADLGFDAAFFDGKVRLGFDHYRKRTEDLLISLTIPLSTGFSSYNTNQGTIENKGFEFDLSADVLTRAFKWDIMGNLSINRNKVIDLGNGLESIYGSTFYSISNQYLHIATKGKPIGSFYGYRIEGIYQNQAEIDDGPVDSSNPSPGDFKFKDISGPDGVRDGQITADDREIIGNPYPDFIFGLTNNWSWKNLSLSVFVQGSIGQDVINGNRFYLDALSRGYISNVRQEAWDNRWTGEGTSNYYPRATTSAYPFNSRFSDFLVEDASYIRMKNVTFSYTLKKVKYVERIKLFVSASNLFTISDYKGYDPEINSKGDKAMTPGMDYGSIPQYRSFSFGANIDF